MTKEEKMFEDFKERFSGLKFKNHGDGITEISFN